MLIHKEAVICILLSNSICIARIQTPCLLFLSAALEGGRTVEFLGFSLFISCLVLKETLLMWDVFVFTSVFSLLSI